MSYSQFSNGTTIIFGFNDSAASTLAAAIGLRPTSLDIATAPEFESEAKNEDGETVSVVIGADVFSFTLSGYLENQSLFDATKSFTFSAAGSDRLFIVKSKKTTKKNTDFQMLEITGTAYPLVNQVDS